MRANIFSKGNIQLYKWKNNGSVLDRCFKELEIIEM
jgi:hypothetical protein